MPAENVQFLPRSELLTFEEIERVVRVAVSLGVRKIRLTGGEPLVRKGLPSLIAALAQLPDLSLGLTTNGLLLAEQARVLYQSGLRSLNVSLDALDPTVFKQVTRREGYAKVLAGIAAAQEAGFTSIKINAVAVRGVTEGQLLPFAHFARASGCEVRFIEYMPLDADRKWEQNKVLLAKDILRILSEGIGPLEPLPTPAPAPASEFQFADGIGRIGVIASVSQPFCGHCNRFRLTSEGQLRSCLFSHVETDLRSALRRGDDDEQIAQLMHSCIAAKGAGHNIGSRDFVYPDRPMYSIGG